jgi:hypothetical protein
MGVVQARGWAAVSNRTSADSGVIDSRVADRLIKLGMLEQRGRDRWGRTTVRAAKGHR